MNLNLITILIIAAVAVISIGLGVLVTNMMLKKSIEAKADNIVKDAEKQANIIKEKRILEARENFLKLKAEHESFTVEKTKQLTATENRLRQQEQSLNQKLEQTQRKEKELETAKNNYTEQVKNVERKNEELSKMHARQVAQLETISELSAEDAKAQLIESLKGDARTEGAIAAKEILEEAKLTANKDAKKIVLQSIQRVAVETAVENAVTVFNIENDEMKGRIIGREGRNIRALEGLRLVLRLLWMIPRKPL